MQANKAKGHYNKIVRGSNSLADYSYHFSSQLYVTNITDDGGCHL